MLRRVPRRAQGERRRCIGFDRVGARDHRVCSRGPTVPSRSRCDCVSCFRRPDIGRVGCHCNASASQHRPPPPCSRYTQAGVQEFNVLSITFGTVMGVTGRVRVDPHGRHCDNSFIRDADLPSRFDRPPVADAAPDWRQAKPEMTQPEATNTELAPLSERLAQICRTLFLMESTERLARLRLVQKYESREDSRVTIEFLRLV